MSKNILIIMPAVLKERTGLHDNMDDKLIYPEIKAAQDSYILPLLGSTLFTKILSDINNDALSGNYKVLIDEYVIDTLCNYVLSELPPALNYQFWNKGVASKTTENSQQPSMSEMFAIVDKYKNRAENYAKRTMMYLRQNSPGLFPEYTQFVAGVDIVTPDTSAFECPIYLGKRIYGKPQRNYNA
jgi:hypothetical protein